MSVVLETSSDEQAINLFGGNLEAFKSKEKMIILVGPAGTGKTYSLCLKMHLYCLMYPGVKVLLCRKTMPALLASAVKSYQKVIEDTGMTENIRVLGESRPSQFIYPYSERKVGDKTYAGVSTIMLSQIDGKNKKALGAEYDMIYINQPDTEGLTELEFTLVSSRARLENAPYRQILSDPNPADDQHWLLLGKERGDWKFYESTHKDNPRLYNQQTQEWTDLGREHLEQLAKLPPHIRQSQLEGKWYSNAGMAFAEYWRPQDHLLFYDTIDSINLGITKELPDGSMYSEIPQDWHHYLAIDWGFGDPFVALLIARHPTQDLFIVHKHIYITEKDIYEVSSMTAQMVAGYNIKAIIADRGRAESAVMEYTLGMIITTAKKGAGSVLESMNIGIAELNSTRWKFVPTSQSLFHEPDPRLSEKNKPMGYEEILYLKKDEKTGVVAEGQPDHFYDAWRYFCRYWVELTNRGFRKETVLWY